MTILLLLLPLADPPESRLDALIRQQKESGGHPYFAFASRAYMRRLGIRVPEDRRDETPERVDPLGLFSGALAIDESLALKRVGRPPRRGPRDVPLDTLTGITIGEHPWKAMIGDRRPKPEPLAALVPHDHWYFTCGSVATLAEVSDLLDAWGGSALRVVQVQDRDYRLRQRYERQLGVTVAAAKGVPGHLVRAIALTGSDLFFAEGTDVSVLIDTPDADALVKALGSPRHEVIGGHVVLSNSKAALARLRETAAGKRPALGASLDFQYMRTVFERGAEAEDAFVFLSDPLIRSLLSPAMRVKMMRRADARAALTLASHAALFQAAETGKMPADADALLRFSKLDAAALDVPDGAAVTWKDGEAASEAYGTLRDGTPLIEQTVEKVTSDERDDYNQFRREYDKLWRQFFDPVGVRFKLSPKEVRAEAYILPLVHSTAYDGLRSYSKGMDGKGDPARLGPAVGAQLRAFMAFGRIDPLSCQLDDSPALGRWLAGVASGKHSGDVPPVVVAAGGKNGEKMAKLVGDFLPQWIGVEDPVAEYDRETTRDYRGVTIKRIPINERGFAAFHAKLKKEIPDSAGPVKLGMLAFFGPKPPPAFYSAWIGGAYHSAFDEGALERRIVAAQKGAKAEGAPAAAGLMVSRKSPHLAAYLEGVLEERTRTKAHSAATLWQALYDAKVVTAAMKDAEREEAALRLLGFVPAVPDGSRFERDARTGQVRNARHGSWARPTTNEGPDASSPLGKLVRSIQSVSADLRFREDGIQTIVTFARK